MSTAIVLLLVILVYRSRSQSGSWYPNHEIGDQPQADAADNDNVTMASFRSLHDHE